MYPVNGVSCNSSWSKLQYYKQQQITNMRLHSGANLRKIITSATSKHFKGHKSTNMGIINTKKWYSIVLTKVQIVF